MRLPFISRFLIACAGAAMALLAVAAPAQALSVPGLTGIAGQHYYFFQDSGDGAVSNQITDDLNVFIPVNPGAHTVTVSTYNSWETQGFDHCDLVVYGGSYPNGVSAQTVYIDNGTSTFTMSGTVPTGGTMSVECVLGPNSALWNINYDE